MIVFLIVLGVFVAGVVTGLKLRPHLEQAFYEWPQ